MPFAPDGPADDPRPPAPRTTFDASIVTTIFHAVAESLVVIDEEGTILAVNDAALRDFGYDRDEIVGRDVAMLMPAPYAEQHGAYLEAYRRTGVGQIIGVGRDVEGRRKDGSVFPLHLRITEFIDHGRTLFLGICRDITERHELSDRIAYLARHDEPTGCLNRYGLIEAMDRTIERAPDQPLVVLFVDLETFVQLDDRRQGVGPALMVQVVERLRDALCERDLLARVGGNELVAVVVGDIGADIAEVAEQAAERVLKCLEPAFAVDGRVIAVRPSVGISLHPEHGRSGSTLLAQADTAMYRAKRSDERVQTFDSELQRRDEERYQLIERLRVALERQEFVLHYQPQFDVMTLEVVGLEALVRWQHPERGLVPPGQFIPALIDSGLMPSLGRWVLCEAAAANSRLIAGGLLDVPMAVNICPQLFGDPGFVELVTRVLTTNDLDPDRLELEIVETTAIDDSVQVAANVRDLRALGVGIAMDDFGTGFSSLAQLRAASFSKLKIDQSFVALLPGEVSDQAIVTAMLDLADGLGMQAIAEGVETREQWSLLRRQGCRLGQGFWYGRPMAEEQLRSWVGTPSGPRASVGELLG